MKSETRKQLVRLLARNARVRAKRDNECQRILGEKFDLLGFVHPSGDHHGVKNISDNFVRRILCVLLDNKHTCTKEQRRNGLKVVRDRRLLGIRGLD